jgi:Protein of unknown function (DUF3800)
MLTAYVDDTGTHDPTGQHAGSEVAGAVGYVARVNRWGKLISAWQKALRSHGVDVFHAVDLRWRRGEFVDWTDGQADALIKDLTRIANKHILFGVGGLLLVKDYMTLAEWFREEVKDPYFVGLQNLFNEILKGPCAPEIRGDRVNFVFDRQTWLEAGTREMFEGLSQRKAHGIFGSITFADKEKEIPLQCADLLAYNVRAELARITYKPHLEMLPAMKELLKNYRVDIAYSDLAALKDLFFGRVIQKARHPP